MNTRTRFAIAPAGAAAKSFPWLDDLDGFRLSFALDSLATEPAHACRHEAVCYTTALHLVLRGTRSASPTARSTGHAIEACDAIVAAIREILQADSSRAVA